MIRFLIRLGLLIVVISVAFLIVSDTGMRGAQRDLAKTGIWVGGAACGAGILLSAAAWAANLTTRRRCPRCGKRVARGHVYCEDHFQEAVSRARDHTRHS